MPKTIIGLLCALAIHSQSVDAKLLAAERSAYIQSFVTSCQSRQLANPVNRDLLAKGQLTNSQIGEFCQCGAVRSADRLDTRVLEEFSRTQDRQPLLNVIEQVTRYCSETRRYPGK